MCNQRKDPSEPMNSSYQEMQETGLNMERLTELKME